MCLYTKTDMPKLASRNIISYKLLKREKNGDKLEYYTPMMSKKFTLNDDNIFKAEGPKYVNLQQYRTDEDIYGVDCGYIHTFKRLDDATTISKTAFNDDIEILIVKCVIPKGTEYFEGSSYGFPCFASDSIKLITKLK